MQHAKIIIEAADAGNMFKIGGMLPLSVFTVIPSQ